MIPNLLRELLQLDFRPHPLAHPQTLPEFTLFKRRLTPF
jgi:hypothetical protein